ncbi:DUF4442 domain-containing protein [Chitinimonas koreensis]|uniref:DUF4442 domain-containing protein n=1 Tax=Chitinimonas koreensis TaxID=356302 RepID=UPI0004226E5B|nr:DUF4442 domain-containing protein [Chitinimonas koreensis]QNM97428.1 DUF4442 domain-containing protein [Chitinimonas koreensis]
MNASTLRRLLNLWPPFLFTGIRAARISADYREADVTLKQTWYNRNYVGTHFGGSLFAMTDPFYMLMLMQLLGRDYFVWDQRAGIDFVAPGRGLVTARFRIDDATLDAIRARTADGEKYLPEFVVDITDAKGEVVARVTKTLYIRRKPAKR